MLLPKIVANYLTDAVNWFKKNDISLYGIQTNPSQLAWTKSPKAYGQVIIDDAALGCPLMIDTVFDENGQVRQVGRPYVDWKEIRRILIEENGVIPIKFNFKE